MLTSLNRRIDKFHLFENLNFSFNKLLFFSFVFLPFTILAVYIDSVYFINRYIDGRLLTNFLTVSYFLLLFQAADSLLRKRMFVMVFLSYIGELLFCKVAGFYAYRTAAIPLYVPFGHAIVYASGYTYAKTNWAISQIDFLKKIFAGAFSILFLSVGFFLNDIFSVVFGVFFFLLLKRKKWDPLYYFIALCVIYIELLGTYFGCWTWAKTTFEILPTSNPPMGAVFIYVGGDVLLAKITSYWKKRKP